MEDQKLSLIRILKNQAQILYHVLGFYMLFHISAQPFAD